MRFTKGLLINGRYQIDQFIGAGSSAEVFKVRDTVRSTWLALKLLNSDLSQYQGFISGFQREAATLARLQHPNIVRFYELVQNKEELFFLMDFIEGTNLRQKLNRKQKTLQLNDVITIYRPICSALHYAHHQEIIHCDIKPENIVIDSSGKVLLTDFGISLYINEETRLSIGNGTPSYMAPEQIQRGRVFPQTDIYALGIMLYELLTGMKPFNGQNGDPQLTIGERIRWEQINLYPPVPSLINNQLSPSIDAIIMRCIHKDPGFRFKDSMELLQALEFEQNKYKFSSDTEKIEDSHVSKETRVNKTSPIQLKKALLFLGIALVIISVAVLFLSQRKAINLPPEETVAVEINENQNYLYPSACMKITVNLQTSTELHECITRIIVKPDNKMQVFFKWEVKSPYDTASVTVNPDTENNNMYLIDNLGNRLDHIATGSGTDQKAELFNGQTKEGWFLFPASDSGAEYFYFVDDDNRVKSPRLYRQWP